MLKWTICRCTRWAELYASQRWPGSTEWRPSTSHCSAAPPPPLWCTTCNWPCNTGSWWPKTPPSSTIPGPGRPSSVSSSPSSSTPSDLCAAPSTSFPRLCPPSVPTYLLSSLKIKSFINSLKFYWNISKINKNFLKKTIFYINSLSGLNSLNSLSGLNNLRGLNSLNCPVAEIYQKWMQIYY